MPRFTVIPIARNRAHNMVVHARIIFVVIYVQLTIIGVLSHIEMEAEDYFFPLEPVINYCKMADHCTHDFVMTCGQDSLGITRLFTDICDMYEYNCDEKRQYRHVKFATCSYVGRSNTDV